MFFIDENYKKEEFKYKLKNVTEIEADVKAIENEIFNTNPKQT